MLGKAMRRLASAGAIRIPGGLRIVRNRRASSLAVVMYHGVVAQPLPVPHWCQLDATEFERQVEFLARTYKVLPLRDIVDRLRRGAPLPAHAACVTFDDGFRNVATTAFPILERHQVPSTVFLITGLVGTDQPAWPDHLFHDLCESARDSIVFEGRRWPLATTAQRAAAYRGLAERLKLMDDAKKEARLADLRDTLGHTLVAPGSPLATMGWAEVERLAGTGLVEFGSHTHTHPILSRCSVERQREELERSRDVLRERLGHCDLFAYPNGRPVDFTSETKGLLRALGYHCGLATIAGLNHPSCDLFGLRRVNVGATTVGRQFELKMVGL
jgi:peptidoglycan/xylan/chitin deacetylase (PgdA/CDA1 family)